MTIIQSQPLSQRKCWISDYMRWNGWLLEDCRLTIVGFLLTEELAERPVASAAAVHSLLFLVTSVGVVSHFSVSTNPATHVIRISTVSGRLLCIILTGVYVRASVALLDVLSFDIELTQLLQIVNQVMSDSNTLFWLLKSIFVAMNLWKDSAILQLQFSHHLKFSHPIWNAAFFQAELVHRDKFQSLLNARGTLLQHLQFLVAQSHVMKEDKQIEFVSSTHREVYDIHNAVCFLQKVESFLPLLSLDELHGRVIQFT